MEDPRAAFSGNASPFPGRLQVAGIAGFDQIEQDFVRIEDYNSLSEENEIMPIQIRGTRMWMPSSIVNVREVFDRIDPI